MKRHWNVLIADDEAVIREGIRKAVDWESLGMAVCAEAEDGEEALELAERHRADVMLVDLNMPIMNGLELIRRIRERLPSCLVVIITGHDEFEYAREAIRLGVQEYVLKPSNPRELTQVLMRIRDRLEQEARQDAYLETAARQIHKNLNLLRERFCLEWTEGNLGREEIADQLEFLKLPPRCPQFVMVVRWPEAAMSPNMSVIMPPSTTSRSGCCKHPTSRTGILLGVCQHGHVGGLGRTHFCRPPERGHAEGRSQF